MKAFYSGHFTGALPAGHRFPSEKYALLRGLIEQHLPGLQIEPAPVVDVETLQRVHDAGYVKALMEGSLPSSAMREIGFPWSQAVVERSLRSVGATLAATRVALQEGVCGNLAGGTHHANAHKGSGFCVFNDAAVSIRQMQKEFAGQTASGRQGRHLQVAVIDLDVHQGNGTAEIFQGDHSVFTLSVHGAKNFPFRKVASTLDVDLPDGCGDVDYAGALEGALFELDHRFNPELVLYLAGADPHEEDRLGRLKLTYDGLVARDRRVFDWCFERRIPLAFMMAGGYGRTLQSTVQVQLNTLRVAQDYWQRWQNRGLHLQTP